ncbi:MAG: hypothetical protein KBD64_04505 [Gammaproteobacteria bacterium]|nr:hypothetical protein [Gammaproteobacteria bacterium]
MASIERDIHPELKSFVISQGRDYLYAINTLIDSESLPEATTESAQWAIAQDVAKCVKITIQGKGTMRLRAMSLSVAPSPKLSTGEDVTPELALKFIQEHKKELTEFAGMLDEKADAGVTAKIKKFAEAIPAITPTPAPEAILAALEVTAAKKSAKIILYQAQSGELVLRFNGEILRNAFARELGAKGFQFVSLSEPSDPSRRPFVAYPNVLNCLFFAHTAINESANTIVVDLFLRMNCEALVNMFGYSEYIRVLKPKDVGQYLLADRKTFFENSSLGARLSFSRSLLTSGNCVVFNGDQWSVGKLSDYDYSIEEEHTCTRMPRAVDYDRAAVAGIMSSAELALDSCKPIGSAEPVRPHP